MAWTKMQPKSRLDELAEKFEDIEHRTFARTALTMP